MSRKNSGTISSTTTPSRPVTQVNRTAPIILVRLPGFPKLSEFLARFWMVENVPFRSVIESSGTSPRWSKLPSFDAHEIDLARPDQSIAPAKDITDLRLPHVPGRLELFRKVFPEWVQPLIAENEKNRDQGVFTAAALEKRNPDYISIYSVDYHVPSETVRRYYGDLLAEKFPYAATFD